MSLPVTDRTRLRRHPERGHHELDTVCAVLDDALHCHVGLTTERGPVVIPTIHARVDRRVYVHGSPVSGLMRAGRAGTALCLTATVVDGLVLARSAFHHSLNYRSAVVFGDAVEVTDPVEKALALDALVEHVVPGRSADVRPPTDQELRATTVIALDLTEASAKVRTGPPRDEEADLDLDVWAGVVPLSTIAGEPEADPTLRPGIDVPSSVRALPS